MEPYIQPVGGYFELERPPARSLPYPDAIFVQSARAALSLLLQQPDRPRRIWLPHYLCDALLAPIHAAHVETAFYTLDNTLNIAGEIPLCQHDWLLYINYFGLCSHHVDTLLKRIPPNQLIIDNAQAFYAPPPPCRATLYSPRKFFGIPDGGLLVSSTPIPHPETRDTHSFARTAHLLKRLGGTPEDGYPDFIAAEQSLLNPAPLRMSALTERLLLSIDSETARQRRDQNFSILHKRLSGHNHLQLPTYTQTAPQDTSSENTGPLSYPLWLRTRSLHAVLIAQRIFIPTYWPNVLKNTLPDSIEFSLAQTCHPLPCDQRYTPEDMHRLADTLLTLL